MKKHSADAEYDDLRNVNSRDIGEEKQTYYPELFSHVIIQPSNQQSPLFFILMTQVTPHIPDLA